MKVLLVNLLGLMMFSCSCNSNETNTKTVGRKYSHETLRATHFDRFIIVRGRFLKSVEEKLEEWGSLSAPGNEQTYHFSKAKMAYWTVIKVPEELASDYYTFHNLVYWFLGYPPEDANYADQSVGLCMSQGNSTSYILYSDHSLSREMDLRDDLFGVFENDEKFILSIPFDEFKATKSESVKDFATFCDSNHIDLERIREGHLNYTDFDVVFHEL